MPHWNRRTGPSPTIADPLDQGDEVSVHCWNPGCFREGALDLPALAAKYGRDLTFDRIRAMLRCSECGKRSERGPRGGQHRTILRLAVTQRMTPNLSHLSRTNAAGSEPPQVFLKRRRTRLNSVEYDEATMCGRYKLTDDPETIRTNLRLLTTPQFPPRYNIAPTQEVPVIRRSAEGERELVNLRWGLVPSWSKELKSGPPLINARAETVADKPSFRDAFKKRRCLFIADGYYEWTGEKTPKQPWLITLTSARPFAFAGIWERWVPKDLKEDAVLSASIVTTIATESLAFIHDRMPVILTDAAEQDAWMNPATSADELKSLLRPYASDQMQAYKVGRAVSNVRIDTPECIQPLAE